MLQHGEDVHAEDLREGLHSYVTKQSGQRLGGKRPKTQLNAELSQLPLIDGAGDEEEEVGTMKLLPSRRLLSSVID